MKTTMLAMVVVVSLGACGTSGTGDEAVPFALSFESDPDGRRFINHAGWDVQLEEAFLAVGPVTLFGNAPPTASWWERIREVAVASAHAHSGFDEYDGGAVRGELLETVVIDLLGEGTRHRVELEGIAGPIRSVSLELRPATSAPLQGMQAWVRGVASRGGEVVPFEGGLVLPGDVKSRRVTGIPAAVELAAETEVVLEIHAQRWFADADFSALPAAGVDGVRPLSADSQVHAAWFLGARGYGAFTVR